MQSLYDVPLRFYENSTGNCPVGSQGVSGYLMLCLLHGLIWQLPCEDVTEQAIPCCVQVPLALIMTGTCCGIVSVRLHSPATFISIQSCFNFLPTSCIDDSSVGLRRKVFSAELKESQWG